MTYRTSSAPSLTDRAEYLGDETPTEKRTIRASRLDKIEQGEALDMLFGNQSVLYAIRLGDGTIKIGCSAHIRQRRNWIQGTEILAITHGDLDDEAAIHESLVQHVSHGLEWYHPTPEVIATVNEMRAQLNLDPIAA